MTDNTPSNAPDAIGTDARDDRTAAAVVRDTGNATPGGGGLGGADAAGSPSSAIGGATPNSPIGATVPERGRPDDRKAEAEAQTQAVRGEGAEPHPRSR